MNERDAHTYAEWFACLADATRIRILNLLSRERRPLKVGEIVDRVEVGQSTVSHHLKRLAKTGFVLVERVGTVSWYRVNERCLTCFPSAADVVMGRVGAPASVADVKPPAVHPDEASEEVRVSIPPPNNQERIREQVRRHYAAAATGSRPGEHEVDCCGAEGPARFGAKLYVDSDRAALPQAAVETSLGCGNPTAVADLRPGDAVLDLGSGGGMDLLLSARRVGTSGKVYGLDMTEEMLALARRNLQEAGVTSCELLKGMIESIPLPAATVDAVISNCVVNLSTDKPAVVTEAFRVLKPGGRLAISDVVADDDLITAERAERGSHVECIAGALSLREYWDLLHAAGFEDVAITLTHEVADSMHAAIVRAIKPGATYALDAVVDDMQPADWPAVRNIYEQGIANGNATFETTTPDWDTWDAAHLDQPRLVARVDDEVVGWTALSPVAGPCASSGVAETSVYVAAHARRRGVGRRLLARLIDRIERSGIWTLQAQMFPENIASLALHQACGFRTVGVRERIGELDGRWRDVVLLERRRPLSS